MSAEFGRVPAHAHIVVPLGTTLDDAEQELILATLRYCGGVRKRAADLLGISPKTLYNRLLAYRLRDARPSAPHPAARAHAPGHSQVNAVVDAGSRGGEKGVTPGRPG